LSPDDVYQLKSATESVSAAEELKNDFPITFCLLPAVKIKDGSTTPYNNNGGLF
jgi:hypothetical protein